MREVAEGVYVLRYPVLDVNSTLILGDGAAMVVDTLSSDEQAGELRDAVRRLTRAPVTVVNTHHHFDHWFGNGVLVDGDASWAQEEAVAILRRDLPELCAAWAAEFPELADELGRATLRPPERTVRVQSTVDVGGREVVLRHLGRGHTAGDLVVAVPDADVVLAGDLVEEGGPPGFDDAYPLEWAETLASLLRLLTPTTVVVPGHGAVVDRAYVAEQHRELTALAWLIRAGHYDNATIDTVAEKAAFDARVARVAVARGYAELAGC
jgi:glyoxylase-like metal-dependent hydrolase (beta-lactamase superfamily II)